MLKTKRDFKRLLIVNDWHCGHLNGLTPPEYDSKVHPGHKYRREVWGSFMKDINELRPFDAIVANGDLVDGPLKHGVEHLSDDPNDQVLMAVATMQKVIGDTPTTVRFVAGTPFHTSVKGVNLEALAAAHVGSWMGREVSYKNQDIVNCNGVNFHFRHHIGGGQLNAVPASLTRQKLINMLWEEKGRQPKCNVFVRGHIHRFVHVQDDVAQYLVCPAMQGGTDYGAQRCDTVTTLGFCYFDIFENGEAICRRIVYRPKVDALVPAVI